MTRRPAATPSAARPAALGIARTRLEHAIARAAPLLVPPDDDVTRALASEDVHDFRVALRRLRSWLRTAESVLGSRTAHAGRRALRRLARRAGKARDAQVQWQWLADLSALPTAGARRAASWLARRQAEGFARHLVRLQHEVAETWPALSMRLEVALRDGVAGASTPAMAAALAPSLRALARRAREALDRIDHVSQVAELHQARLDVKRLRYGLEGACVGIPASRAPLGRLRRLQQLLGEANDAHELLRRVTRIIELPRTTGRPALRDLRMLRAALRRRELAAFRASMDALAAPATAAMWTRLDTLARAMAAGIPAAPAAG